MSKNKTIANNNSVTTFISNIANDVKRNDATQLVEIMKTITNQAPIMWGDSIVGFGQYHYKYASGREGDMFLTGFSPRKQNMTIYFMVGFNDFEEPLKKLGKCKWSKSCLYFKKLADINLDILKEMIQLSVEKTKAKYH